jgi:dTMP kinase
VKKALFITFEGPEGSGKTTHIELLAAHLRAKGRKVLVTREPGGTSFAAGIRKLLLDGKDGLSPMAELFLYEADRAQHLHETLIPALRQKKIILCDRYTDSTVAYQGYGRGLDLKTIETLNAIASDELTPHLTILLDVPAERGLKLAKLKKNHHDRIERAGLAFHQRVRKGFLALAKKNPKRFRVIAQQKDLKETQRLIQNVLEKHS